MRPTGRITPWNVLLKICHRKPFENQQTIDGTPFITWVTEIDERPERFVPSNYSVDPRTETEPVEFRSTMPSTVHFGRLAVEILERIFLELHYFDIRSVKLVSGDGDIPVCTVVDDSNRTHS